MRKPKRNEGELFKLAALLENTIVVSNFDHTGKICNALLGFRNLLTTAISSASSVDPNYPFELAYDFKTNTEYSPLSASGSVEINITNDSPKATNYLGIFSKNAADCGLSVKVELLNSTTGLYEEVGFREAFGNAKPQMIYWPAKYSIAQRITLTFTSKCYIATLVIGEAILFSRTVSVGYQPARNASLDEVSNFSTEGNNFIQGRRITNGFEEKAPINYQTYDFIDSWWPEFMNYVLDSKPLFFMANIKKQQNCVFGLQVPRSLTKPSYKNSHHCDIDLEINGWA